MVAIVKYNAGNARSVGFALDRLSVAYRITDDADTIAKAEKVIFPGVGEASSAMRFLKERNLVELMKGLKQPVLGICLGMHLMCKMSEENDTQCLGIFDLPVKRFIPVGIQKVPHIGWNNLTQTKGWIGPELSNTFVYFVHSYYVPVNRHTVANSEHIVHFCAALQKGNFYAVQFHPEKSGKTGEKVIKRFLDL